MDIRYGRVAIYVLTFLGYIYSGYGSDLITNLKDAFLAAETIFGDVVENIGYLAEKFKNLNEIFNAAVEEECIYKCPTGVNPKPNNKHVPTYNGCGSQGLNIDSEYLPVSEMTKCCNAHDVCYDTCNNVKEKCDVDFRKCLYKYCDTYDNTVVGSASVIKACKGAAKMLFTGTLTLGCKSYIDAQQNACYCPPTYGWKDKKTHKPHQEL